MSIARRLFLTFAFLLTASLPATAQIIEASHGDNTFLYNSDFKSAYAAYSVTNGTGADIADAWVEISGLGPDVNLSVEENGVFQIGSLLNGATAPAFFYLTTTASVSHQNPVAITPDLYTVSLFSGEPGNGGTFVTSADFSFTATRNTIAASANKITTITPTLVGPTLTVVVEGLTGNVGGTGIGAFSPAVLDSWKADDWELQSTVVDIPSASILLENDLWVQSPALAAAAGMGFGYTATYVFDLTSGLPAELSPVSWFNSGGNPLKHSTFDDGVVTALADLSIEKTVDEDAPLVGTTVTFTVTVSNIGAAATGVVIGDVLTDPWGCFADRVYDPAASWDGAAWTIDVPAGTQANPGTVVLTVSGTAACTHAFTNTAVIQDSGDVMDVNPDNDGPVEVTVTPFDPPVDLEVSKEIIGINLDKDSHAYGEVTYRLSVENLGTEKATGNAGSGGDRFLVIDPLDPLFSFVSSTAGMGAQGLGYGSYDSGTGTWGLIELEVGATKFIDITVVLTDPTGTLPNEIGNTATLDPNTVVQGDLDPSNNSASAILRLADIAIVKEVDDPSPDAGQSIMFTITVTNNGGSSVSGLEIADILSDDSGLADVVAPWGDISANWVIGDLSAFNSIQAVVTATVIGASDFSNMAVLASLDDGILDPIAENNMGTADVVPNSVDIAVDKEVQILDELAGRVVFTLTVTNFGPSDATNLVLEDTADPAIIPDLGTVSGDGVFDGSLWTIASLQALETATVVFEADILSAAVLAAEPVNALDFVSVDQFEVELPDTPENPEIGDEHDQVAVQVADILVQKTVSNHAPELGETISFEVKVTNQGPSAATNVLVEDPIVGVLTGSMAAIIIDKSAGSFDVATGTWTIPGLAPGEMATLTITGEVSDLVPFKNTATLVALEGAVDSNPDNNMAMAVVTPEAPDEIDLELVKSVSPETAEVGDVVTFEITVTNSSADGPVVTATGVVVSDYLPDGLVYLAGSATSPADNASVASVDEDNLVWVISSLASGESITLAFQARVDAPGDHINVAEIWDVDQKGLDRDSQTGAEGGAFDPDSNPADAEDDQDDASVWVPEPQADLSLTKTVSDETPKVGDEITFTVTVRNEGLPTWDIVVVDAIDDPKGCFQFTDSGVGISTGTLSHNSGTGYVWRLDLGTGDAATFTITGWVACEDGFVNNAEITDSGALADSSQGNDWASVPVDPTGTVVPPTSEALCYLVADNDAEGGPSLDVLTVLYAGSTTDVKIGHTGTRMIEAAAFNPWNRQLYAADARTLGIIDLQTGAFSALGDFGSGWGLDAYGQPRERGFLDVDGLAFDPFGSDRLYGTVRKVGEPDLLIRIDPATGRHVPEAFGANQDYVTIQGVYGLTDIDDIAISPWDGTLYAVNNRDGMSSRLVTIDKSTGQATGVLDLPLENVEGLAFYGDGTLYGTAGEGDESIVVIDLASNTASVQAGLGAGGRDYEAIDCLTNKTNRVSVVVFQDLNQDGTMQHVEGVAANIQVQLVRDIDGNGVVNGIDVPVAVSTTGPTGTVVFEPAAKGAFLVQAEGTASSQASFGTFGEPAITAEVALSTVTSTANETGQEVPASFELQGNYPNPFNPSTTISFSVPETAHISVSVHDVLGREIAVLADGLTQAGTHAVSFQAGSIPSGTYLVRMAAPGFVSTKSMTLIK